MSKPALYTLCTWDGKRIPSTKDTFEADAKAYLEPWCARDQGDHIVKFEDPSATVYYVRDEYHELTDAFVAVPTQESAA